MSAKFLYSLSDENPDLQKQIGCMNGLFELFDRHHFLGSRRIATPNHKRLPPGQNGRQGTEPKIASQKIKENNLKKYVKEKQRVSFESPRTSFSTSSCSSGFSSADCSKASQVDRSSLCQTTCSETPRLEISNYQSNASLQSNQHSLDLRNVVKDSIYREARGLLIRTATKVEAGRHQTLKYIDSPRPLQSPKPANTRNTSLNESSHVLPKLREAPRMSNERNDGSLSFAPRDAPRFSYDGRGSQDALKIKLKDLPRLSLDSRESRKSNFLLGELNRSSIDSNDIRNQQQESGSYKGPSSVVAKLMGLEELPDPILTNGNQRRQLKTCQDLKDDPLSRSSRFDEKKNRISGSPRNSKKEPSSPNLTNASSKKPVTTRSPIEPAPWKQLDGNRDQTSALKCRETPLKAPNSSLTVYGEIEKRFAELGFKESGKGLRALKQILEVKQKSKQMLETRKEDQASNFVSHTNSILGQSSVAPNLRKIQISNAVSATFKGTSSPTCLRSPIQITKPVKFMENASNSTSSVVATGTLSRLRTGSPADARNHKIDKRSYKDLTPKPNPHSYPSSPSHSRDRNNARTLRFNQISKELSPTARENPKLAMSSETTRLKVQQKKLESGSQSRCTSPASNQSRSRRQSSRLQAEPTLAHRNPRHKSHNLQRSDDQLSDVSSDMRDFSQQGDASSMKSESNMSVASYSDIEVTSADRSCKAGGTFSRKHEKKQNNPVTRFSVGGSTAEPPRTALEQPSPVSVLDATFYGDESPSPVKKKSNAFEDDEGLIPNEADWSPRGLNHLATSKETSLRFKTDCRKAENIQHMVRKLMNLDSIHEWSTVNEISPAFSSPNPDHKYIVEVMLASGLLSELDSCFLPYHLYPSDHLVNPTLFPALEQTKASIRLENGKHNGRKIKQLEPIEKNHRQLIFDAVNEIVVRKLVKEGSYKQWLSPSTPEDRRPKGQQLVRDLCSEIDKIQTASNISSDNEDDSLKSILWGDLTLGSMDWTECRSEIPWVVLDVERLIFKDLICEVISGEAENPQGQAGRHCRRLFSK
ncbi:protein LONGIFOLIA 1-like [Durio zibethinus]|uniref:Protein LONGIFOLIA 1-like n=1 Tax=Durio zibethinus TaxID=66656 RepID=A0A6P5YMY0_DURZI|nr:protein LONGIFOLIA 1-like [Durio zibethinus]